MASFEEAKVADFVQVREMAPRVGRNRFAVEGACLSFSFSWIADVVRDPGGPAKDRMARLAKDAGNANPLLMKVAADRWTREEMAGSDDLMLQIHGLLTDEFIAYKAYDAGEILPALRGGVSAGFLYQFWFSGGVVGAQGGGHATAFYVTRHGGKLAIHFFDPNYGEFVVNEDELAGFWTELTGKYGQVHHHRMRKCTPTRKVALAGR